MEYEPAVALQTIAVSNKTLEVLARKALASTDIEFRAHVELLLGRYQAARAKTERAAAKTAREAVAA
jgi:hypothetical protein